VLPTLVFWFVQAMLMFGLAFSTMLRNSSGMSGEWIMVVPSLITGLVWIGLDIMFIVVSRRKVTAHFREYVALDGRAGYAPVARPPQISKNQAGTHELGRETQEKSQPGDHVKPPFPSSF